MEILWKIHGKSVDLRRTINGSKANPSLRVSSVSPHGEHGEIEPLDPSGIHWISRNSWKFLGKSVSLWRTINASKVNTTQMYVGEDSNRIVMELWRESEGIVTEYTDSRQNQGSSFSRFPYTDEHEHLTSDISWLWQVVRKRWITNSDPCSKYRDRFNSQIQEFWFYSLTPLVWKVGW